jgi:hypothetical protein
MRLLHLYLFIIFVSLFPLAGIFSTPLLFHSHDGLVHLPRIAAYFKALKDVALPVRWVGDLNYGYGMPLFNFIYPLPYLVASLFIALGVGLVNSFKIALSLSFLLSGIFMFLFAKEFFSDTKKALLVSIFYQFAPFRLVELLIRGSFGEVYTYAFFPLLIFSLTKLLKKYSYTNFLLVAIATFLLVISHNGLSLVFFSLTIIFAVLFAKTKKTFFISIFSLSLGLFLSGFYWIPAIFEHKYTYGDLFMKNLYLSHFPPFQNFFLPNITNTPSLQTGGISVQFGFFHLLAIVSAIFFLIKNPVNNNIRKFFIFQLFTIAIMLFFMQPISKPIWAHTAILRQFQFPWRLLGIISFSTSTLAASFSSLSFFKKPWTINILLTLTVISTALYWKPALGYDSINENYYWNFPLDTTYYGETDVIWSAGPAKLYPQERVSIIEGKGIIENFIKKTAKQTFTIDAKTDVRVVSNTEYFPGWRVFVNGLSKPVQFQDPNYRGLITFFAPKGKSIVVISFGETPIRFFSDMLSLVTVFFFILFFFLRKKIAYVKKRIH